MYPTLDDDIGSYSHALQRAFDSGIAKANPWHDAKTGRFTHALGGSPAVVAGKRLSPRQQEDVKTVGPAGTKTYIAERKHGASHSDAMYFAREDHAAAKVKTSPPTRVHADAAFKPVENTKEMREQLAQTHNAKIAPAWKNVIVHPNPTRGKAELRATGIDDAGRKQYVYSATHKAQAAIAKYKKNQELDKQLPKLDRALKRDAMADPVAAVTLVIRKMGLRNGSDRETGAQVKAFGASNMQARHVTVNAASVTFNFTGKKGVALKLTTKDPEVRRVVEKHKGNKKGTQQLFDGVDEAKVNAYMKRVMPGGYTAKTLRTSIATKMAFDAVSKRTPPRTAAEAKKLRNEIADEVSTVLGNTRTVALNSYIDPIVFAKWNL